MVTDQFGAIVQEIGRALNYNISPNIEDTCSLPLPNGINVQMEMDDRKEFFIMEAEIGNIPPGRYKEEIFREAMVYNGLKERVGIFAYSEIENCLILFKELPARNLNGEKVASVLIPFGEKASTWKKAIARGEIPPSDLRTTSSEGGLSSLMGLKP